MSQVIRYGLSSDGKRMEAVKRFAIPSRTDNVEGREMPNLWEGIKVAQKAEMTQITEGEISPDLAIRLNNGNGTGRNVK